MTPADRHVTIQQLADTFGIHVGSAQSALHMSKVPRMVTPDPKLTRPKISLDLLTSCQHNLGSIIWFQSQNFRVNRRNYLAHPYQRSTSAQLLVKSSPRFLGQEGDWLSASRSDYQWVLCQLRQLREATKVKRREKICWGLLQPQDNVPGHVTTGSADCRGLPKRRAKKSRAGNGLQYNKT